jgi:hypothetical protein
VTARQIRPDMTIALGEFEELAECVSRPENGDLLVDCQHLLNGGLVILEIDRLEAESTFDLVATYKLNGLLRAILLAARARDVDVGKVASVAGHGSTPIV